jgi:hypothetical protein
MTRSFDRKDMHWIHWILIVLPFLLLTIVFVFLVFSIDFLSLSFFNWISSVFFFSYYFSLYACEKVLLKRRPPSQQQQRWIFLLLLLDPSRSLISRVITLLYLTLLGINDRRLERNWEREKVCLTNIFSFVHITASDF